MAFNRDGFDRNGRNGEATFSNYNYLAGNGDVIADIVDGYFDESRFRKESGWPNGIIVAAMADGAAIFQIGADGSTLKKL